MKLSIIQILLFGLPEGLLISYVGLGLMNIKAPIQQHIKITFIYTCGVIILRNIFNLYGIHVIIIYLILTLLFKIFIEIEWSLAIIASLLGCIVLLLGETLFISIIFQYFNTNIQKLINNHLILINFLTKLPLLISSIVIYSFNFSFFKFNDFIGGRNEMEK